MAGYCYGKKRYRNTARIRMHSFTGMVIDLYARGRFIGNTFDLFEPGFGRAIAPYIYINQNFPKNWFTNTYSCDKICHRCGCRKAILEQVLIINTEVNQ